MSNRDRNAYFRPENAWKPIQIDGKRAYRAVVRGHELYAMCIYKRRFDWWITSDTDGLVVTARGKAPRLEDAQKAAVEEARSMAYGSMSTRALLPSEVVAARNGSLKRLDVDKKS